jgi:hypothetical protein
MAKWAIYNSTLGTSTARPVTGIIELPDEPASTLSSRLSDQTALLNVNEATIRLTDATEYVDLDNDTSTYDYTVNPTLTPPVTLTAVTVNRMTLAEKQADLTRRRDQLIEAAILASNYDRYISDGDLSTYATYISSLRGISSSEADPDNVVFPTLGTINGAADRVLARQYKRANILDTVGLSSGVPTGGIIETATNANGLYIRFADGGQICRARITPVYFSGVRMATSWTFPAAFYSLSSYSFVATFSERNNSNTVAGLADTDIEECTIVSKSRSTTAIDIHVLSHTYSFVSGDLVWLDIIALGRWAA